MTDKQDTPFMSMRSKPVQMALLTLGYEHHMIVDGEDVQLRIKRPGVDVVFRIDPTTLCVEAVFTWHGRIPRDSARDALQYLVQINRTVFEPQFALVDTDEDSLVMQGRVFSSPGPSFDHLTLSGSLHPQGQTQLCVPPTGIEDKSAQLVFAQTSR